jgi:hypothetical protein
VLVIANQRARPIRRERGLAGARQSEEDRNRTVRADVRRAMDGEHLLLWEEEIHHAEDRLPDLTRVMCPTDERNGVDRFQCSTFTFSIPWWSRPYWLAIPLVIVRLSRRRMYRRGPYFFCDGAPLPCSNAFIIGQFSAKGSRQTDPHDSSCSCDRKRSA